MEQPLGTGLFLVALSLSLGTLLALLWILRTMKGKDMHLQLSGWGIKLSVVTKDPGDNDGP